MNNQNIGNVGKESNSDRELPEKQMPEELPEHALQSQNKPSTAPKTGAQDVNPRANSTTQEATEPKVNSQLQH